MFVVAVTNEKRHEEKIKEIEQALGQFHPMKDLSLAILYALSGNAEDSRRAHREWINMYVRYLSYYM